MTPGPNNILALSSATSHGFRQSTRVLAGMSLGFLIVRLLCAGLSFSLAVIDPAAVHLLSWAGAAYIVWLAWKIATSPTKEDGLQTKPISFRPGRRASVELGGGGIYSLAGVENSNQSNKGRWASDKTNPFVGQRCFAVWERQNHFGWHYSTVDVCPAANAGAKLDNWRQRFAGDDWEVWEGVLGAGGAPGSAFVWRGWSPVKARARAAAGLWCGTHFLLMKKAEEVALVRLVTCYLSLTGFQ